jgi:hypothetical protein
MPPFHMGGTRTKRRRGIVGAPKAGVRKSPLLELRPQRWGPNVQHVARAQQEIEGVLDFYINTQPYDPDAFEPGKMDPAPDHPAP